MMATQQRTPKIKNLLQKLFALSLILLCYVPLTHAAFTADVPRQTYQEGELIILTLSTDRQNLGAPDLTPLEQDFEILSQSQASQISQINGQLSVRITWRIELLPLKTGNVNIPALNLGGESSRPIALTIQKAGAPKVDPQGQNNASNIPLPELFLTLEADDTNPYVQQEVLLTLTIHHTRPLQKGQLSQLEIPNAVVTEIKEQTEDYKLIQGRTYTTLSVHYLITPQKSGPLTIEPLRLVAELGNNSGAGWGFRSRLFDRGDRRVAASDSLILNVRPKPANYPAQATWLPAKSLTLADDWSQDGTVAQIGEAITRSVNLKIEGQTARILPEITYAPQANAKIYADQSHTEEDANRKGTHSQKSFSFAIVPTGPGTITLPEQTIHWWNVVQDRLETVTLPGRTWSVASSQNNANAQNTQSYAQPSQITQAPSTPNPSVSNGPRDDSALPQRASPQTSADAPYDAPTKTPGWMKALVTLLTLLWLATCALAGYLYIRLNEKIGTQSTTKPAPKTTARHRSWQQAKKAVIKAAKAQAYDALIPALIAWGKLHWQDTRISALGHLIPRLSGSPLQAPVRALEHYRYHPNPAQQPDLAALITAIEQVKQPNAENSKRQSGSEPLAPLHPASIT